MSSVVIDGPTKEYMLANSKHSTLLSDSSGTAVSFEQNRLHLKPQYRFDLNASVNAEESPITKDLTAKFSDLSLDNRNIAPPPQLNFSSGATTAQNEDVNWLPTILRNQHPEEIYESQLDVSKAIESLTDINDDSVVIHDNENFNTDEKLPDWKRAALEAEDRKSKIQPKLKEFFEPLEENEKVKDQQQSTVDSSTFNTAFKLFGQHDSFTSNKLNQIIANIQSTKALDNNNSKPLVELIQEELANDDSIAIRNETKVEEANKTEDYIQNANALFANLKLRGAPLADQWQHDNITSTTTISSSSLEESWDHSESVAKNSSKNEINATTNVDLTIDTTEDEALHNDTETDYNQAHLDLNLLYNRTFPYLQPENQIITPKVKNVIYHKPTLIKPEDFEMRYDTEKKEWIPTDNHKLLSDSENDENVLALDAINDLTTVSRTKHRAPSILKQGPLKPKDMNSRSEVSFRLPSSRASTTSSRDDTFDTKSRSRLFEVTNASQIQDISFSESKRKLINVLTTINPDGDWDELYEVELSGLDIANLNDFDKIVPHLKKVDLSNNKIQFLEGLPRTVKNTVLSGNLLNSLTSFTQFKNLRYLDISDNSFDNLNSLSCLDNLTYLNASNNAIKSIEGISQLDSLTTINLSANRIEGSIDFKNFNLTNLQKLDISENKVTEVSNLEALINLIVLKLDENQLQRISSSVHPMLKKLSLKMNRLRDFNCRVFPSLRVLRVDGNDIANPLEINRLSYLEEFSAKSLTNSIDYRYSYDLKDLDLSGASRLNFSQLQSFKYVKKLLLTAMNLTTLPTNFHKIFPNVKELNLNFNKLSDVSQLEQLTDLRSLYLVSNNLKDLVALMKSLSGSRHSLKKLDLRLNPINKGFYSYVFSPHETEAYQGKLDQKDIPDNSVIQLDTVDDIQSFSIHYAYLLKNIDEDSDWIVRDKAHLKSLKLNHSKKEATQSLYIKRLNYEALILRLCGRCIFFDGKLVSKDDMVDAKIRVREIFSG